MFRPFRPRVHANIQKQLTSLSFLSGIRIVITKNNSNN